MDIKTSSELFESYLEMDRKPVGVKFFFNQEEFDNCEIPQRERKVTYCNSVQLASKGHSMKLTKSHQACLNGSMALNFIDTPEGIVNGKKRFELKMYSSAEIAKKVHSDMEFMKDRPVGILVMPLENYKYAPDIVIVVSGAYNVMRIIQGHGYFNGYTNNLRTVGLQAVCQDLTTYPYNSEDINISLLCPGTRLVADWQMNEIGIGIPFKHWFNMVEGIIETTNPFARNKKKKTIIKSLNERGFDSSKIKIGQNYDDGSYKGGKVDE